MLYIHIINFLIKYNFFGVCILELINKHIIQFEVIFNMIKDSEIECFSF